MQNGMLAEWGPLVARVFLAALFIISGFGMLMNFSGTAQFLGSVSPVPGVIMAVLAIAIKVGGGLALAAGFRTVWAAWALFAFSFAAILLAHMNWADQMQMTQALKNLSIMGGLLMVVLHGPGSKALDNKASMPM